MNLNSPSNRLNLSSLALVFVAASAALAACSSSDTKTNASVGGAASVGGGGNAGSSNTTGGTSAFTILSRSVGRFFVKVNAADPSLSTQANTTVDGVVKDGLEPNPYVETALLTESSCTLYKLVAPSCANANSGAGCDVSTQVCTATDTCTKIPTRHSVGTATVSGVATSTGTAPFTLTAVSNSYSVGGDITLVYPGFNEGDAIKIALTGGDYTAFELSAKGIKQLVLGNTTYQVSATSPLNLTWTPGGSANDARIQVTLNLSHHGGSKGYLACDVADTGSLAISAAQIAGLINLGVAGYPTVTVTRRSLGTATIAPGQVVLSVESSITPALTVEGYVSCTNSDNSECPTGQSCNTDLKLCE